MQSIRSRQLTSQITFDGHAFTASKPWHFPNLTLIDGFNVSTQFTQLNGGLQLANNAAAGLGAIVTSNTASITTNANRVEHHHRQRNNIGHNQRIKGGVGGG